MTYGGGNLCKNGLFHTIIDLIHRNLCEMGCFCTNTVIDSSPKGHSTRTGPLLFSSAMNGTHIGFLLSMRPGFLGLSGSTPAVVQRVW